MMGRSEEADVTLAQAVATIDRATSFTEPLRRRAEGVTIALWGFVTACILLSNGLVDDVYGFYQAGGWRTAASMLLWAPWAALGVAGTLAVWRIAEVSAARREAGRRRSPAVILAWLAALVGIALATAFFPVGGAGGGIVAIGLLWLAVGALDLYRATAAGRRTLLTVGALIVLVGAVYGWASRGWSVAEVWRHFEAVAVLSAGGAPIVAGLLQALRG